MVTENPTWGAPRIHGELKMLGFEISERTVLRWMQKAPRNPEPAKRRRRILHCNVTRHPTSAWVCQQLREAFPYDMQSKYLIFDRATNFSDEVASTIKSFGIEPKKTSFRSPWQNGVAERFVGSCRRDLLDHVIVLNERHLNRLMGDYVRYYRDDRTHLGLEKQTSAGRTAAKGTAVESKVVCMPRLGGLHHRYDLAA
jgi:hypothetical protein